MGRRGGNNDNNSSRDQSRSNSNEKTKDNDCNRTGNGNRAGSNVMKFICAFAVGVAVGSVSTNSFAFFKETRIDKTRTLVSDDGNSQSGAVKECREALKQHVIHLDQCETHLRIFKQQRGNLGSSDHRNSNSPYRPSKQQPEQPPQRYQQPNQHQQQMQQQMQQRQQRMQQQDNKWKGEMDPKAVCKRICVHARCDNINRKN